eukprot:m.95031 g.95031  ORF g.95031 m.95031 type:complete len:203 (-) comp13881_c2_seq4:228-836(-)
MPRCNSHPASGLGPSKVSNTLFVVCCTNFLVHSLTHTLSQSSLASPAAYENPLFDRAPIAPAAPAPATRAAHVSPTQTGVYDELPLHAFPDASYMELSGLHDATAIQAMTSPPESPYFDVAPGPASSNPFDEKHSAYFDVAPQPGPADALPGAPLDGSPTPAAAFTSIPLHDDDDDESVPALALVSSASVTLDGPTTDSATA